MKIGKLKMFLGLNGLIAIGLILYFSVWIFSRTVTGDMVRPYEPNKLTVRYQVEGQNYQQSYMRNGWDYRKTKVPIRYFVMNPELSRVNTFMGIFAEPLAWWLVFLIASAMLLLTNNGVFSKGTVFILQKKIPWISMEEFFPIPWNYDEYTDLGPSPQKKKEIKKLERN
ncbi:MAG: hypothetical protein ACXWCZ_12855 [Flavisolibacter sp.]